MGEVEQTPQLTQPEPSGTPRTDNEVFGAPLGVINKNIDLVTADFARTLEQDLIKGQARVKDLEKAGNEMVTAIKRLSKLTADAGKDITVSERVEIGMEFCLTAEQALTNWHNLTKI